MAQFYCLKPAITGFLKTCVTNGRLWHIILFHLASLDSSSNALIIPCLIMLAIGTSSCSAISLSWPATLFGKLTLIEIVSSLVDSLPLLFLAIRQDPLSYRTSLLSDPINIIYSALLVNSQVYFQVLSVTVGSPASESKETTGSKSQIILAIIRMVEYNKLTDFLIGGV